MVTDWQLLSVKLNVRCSTLLLPVFTPLFSPCLDRCHCRVFMFGKKISPNSAARQLTYNFLSDLCPLHLHFIASFAPTQFHSLDFPTFFFFGVGACRAITQLLLSFKLPNTADIQHPMTTRQQDKLIFLYNVP